MNEDKSISRRGFLKTAAAIGAALTITPTLNKVQAAEAVLSGSNGTTTKKNGMEWNTAHWAPATLQWKCPHSDSGAWE